MVKLLFTSTFLILTIFGQAQDWSVIAKSNAPIMYIYGDEESNLLYATGYFTSINQKPFRHIASWDGINWTGLDNGLENLTSRRAYQEGGLYISRYRNKLLVAGTFDLVGNAQKSRSVAFWNTDSLKWETCDWNPNNSVSSVLEMGDTTYVMGGYDSIAGKLAPWINYLHQGQWTNIRPPNWFPTYSKMAPYKGDLYIGVMPHSGPTDNNRLIRWDGSMYHVKDHKINSRNSNVYALTEYQGDLYISGTFSKADGNIGNNLMKWDGQQFQNVGDVNGLVFGFKKHNGILYAYGSFKEIGGKEASKIAWYNGRQWYSFPSMVFNSTKRIFDIGFLNDTLYISRNVSSASEGPYQILRYNGKLSSISKNVTNRVEISLYPNPTHNSVTIKNFKTEYSVEVFNLQGAKIYTGNQPTLSTLFWEPGIYLVHIHSENFDNTLKLIKQ